MKYNADYFTGMKRVDQLAAVESIMADRSLTNAARKSALAALEQVIDGQDHALAAARRLSGAADLKPAAPVHKSARGVNSASPLAFSVDAIAALHRAAASRQSLAIKAFNSTVDLLPGELAPQILGPVHEVRLLDYLPSQPINAPSYEYIRHSGTSGSASVVAEGGAKPEVTFTVTPLVATAVKIAAHSGVSFETMNDHAAFVSYMQSELTRHIVDVENDELLNGDGSTGHLTGLLETDNILTRAVDGGESPLDTVEAGISDLRVGSSLAEPDLLVVNPATWSALRRTKDLQDRYLVQPDPTQGAAATLWGVQVLPTTTIAAGTGLLLDSTKFGQVLVREPIGIQTGTSGTDFTHNVVRFVAETRLALAVERPTALLKLTGLPTGAPAGS